MVGYSYDIHAIITPTGISSQAGQTYSSQGSQLDEIEDYLLPPVNMKRTF